PVRQTLARAPHPRGAVVGCCGSRVDGGLQGDRAQVAATVRRGRGGWPRGSILGASPVPSRPPEPRDPADRAGASPVEARAAPPRAAAGTSPLDGLRGPSP